MRDAVRLNAAVGIAVLVLLPMRTVHAYDVRTHGSVAGESFDASKALQRYLRDVGLRLDARFDPQAASPPGKLAEFVNVGTARDWMIEGVIREDDYRQSHAQQPLQCEPPQNPESAINRPTNHFFDVQRGGRGLTVDVRLGTPARDWALGLDGRGPGETENQFSLIDARGYQLDSFIATTRLDRDLKTARMFRALGQVIHVLQDMAQPQHTRNDPHMGCGIPTLETIGGQRSWYEVYTETRALGQNYRGRSAPSRPLVLSGYDPVGFRADRDYWANANHSGLAEYSSTNFFSAGTNFGSNDPTQPCGGLVRPVCAPALYEFEKIRVPVFSVTGRSVTGTVGFYVANITDRVTGKVDRVRVSSRSLWDQHLKDKGGTGKFSLNTYNYDSMADVLLPRAVGYSAGLLDYFFRGSLDASVAPDPDDRTGTRFVLRGAVNVTSGDGTPTDELAAGTITLYADDADGIRTPVDGFTSLTVSRDPFQSASFVLPPQAIRLVAVYQGRLGEEENAVIGKVISGVEELYIAGNGGVDDVWFRDATDNLPLGVARNPQLGGQRPLGVAWSVDGRRFAVWVAGWEYHIFRLNRSQADGRADITATWERSEEPFDSDNVAMDVAVNVTTTGTQFWSIATPTEFVGDRCDTVRYIVTPASATLGGTISKRRSYTMRDLFYTPFPGWAGQKVDQASGGRLIKDVSAADGTDFLDTTIRDTWLDEDGQLVFALTLLPNLTLAHESYQDVSTAKCEGDGSLTITTPPRSAGSGVEIADPLAGVWTPKAGWLWRSFRLPATFDYRDDVSQAVIEERATGRAAYFWQPKTRTISCTSSPDPGTRIMRRVTPACTDLSNSAVRLGSSQTAKVVVATGHTITHSIDVADDTATVTVREPFTVFDASVDRAVRHEYRTTLDVPLDVRRHITGATVDVNLETGAFTTLTTHDAARCPTCSADYGEFASDVITFDIMGSFTVEITDVKEVDGLRSYPGDPPRTYVDTVKTAAIELGETGDLSTNWVALSRGHMQDPVGMAFLDQAFQRQGMAPGALWPSEDTPSRQEAFTEGVSIDWFGTSASPSTEQTSPFGILLSEGATVAHQRLINGTELRDIRVMHWDRDSSLARYMVSVWTDPRENKSVPIHYGMSTFVMNGLGQLVTILEPPRSGPGGDFVRVEPILVSGSPAQALWLRTVEKDRYEDVRKTELVRTELPTGAERVLASSYDDIAGLATVLGRMLTSAPGDFARVRQADGIKDLSVTVQGPSGSGWLDLGYSWFSVVAEAADGVLHPSNLAAAYAVTPGLVSHTLRWTNPTPPPVRVHVFRWSESEDGAYVASLEGPATEWVEGSTPFPGARDFQPGARLPARRLVRESAGP